MKSSCIALIGYGSIGIKHLGILKKLYPNNKFIVVTKRNDIKKNKPITYIKDYKKLKIYKPKIAFICTPSNMHVNQAIYLSKLNCNLFIEKPLSNNFRNMQKLLKIVKKNKIFCYVGYVLRFNASLIYLKKIIKKKIIGKLQKCEIRNESYLPNWRKNIEYYKSVSSKKKLGGGVLNELSHEIDYSTFLFGMPNILKAKLKNTGKLNIDKDIEDEALVKFFFNNKFKINCKLSFSKKKLKRFCFIKGSKGEIYLDLTTNVLKVFNKKKIIKIKNFKNKTDIMFKNQTKFFINKVISKNLSTDYLKNSIYTNLIISKCKISNKRNQNIYL